MTPTLMALPAPAQQKSLPFVHHDGGRNRSGFTGTADDCVTRAIAIATGRPYREIYERLAQGNANERATKRSTANSGRRTARHGINTKRQWFTDYMQSLGWSWMPTMLIGQGCKTHLAVGELPMGRLIVAVSRHYTTVIDGVIHDTWDCSRGGTRCVYGFWSKD